MMAQENRVVVLIDMDCFYCQVEEKLNPELRGQPIAVVQYNPWKGGGIIAVNYVARARGVTRHMRGDEAKEKCPEIQLPSVPCLRGKADITKYRDAGKEVATVLQRFTSLLERASIDEAYLDITVPVQERLKTLNINTVMSEMLPNTFALGYDSVDDFIADIYNYGGDSMEFDYEHANQLLVGAVIVSEIRAAVYEETGYTCSAGIAHNKILAKLVCGMNKPNKQTVLPKHSINTLYSTLRIKKVKHLGGKFGDTVAEMLKITNMSELQAFTEKELQTKFDEKNGTWLYNIARGIDLEPVQAKFNPKSIGCCKQLRGKSALVDLDSLKKWLMDLAEEIVDRLEKDSLENNRSPKQMVVSFSTCLADRRDVSSSRSYNFITDDELSADFFAKKSLELIMDTTEGVKLKGDEENRRLKATIKILGISVGKFEDVTDNKKTRKILDYFGAGTSKEISSNLKENNNDKNIVHVKTNNKNKREKEYMLHKFFKSSNKLNSDELVDGTDINTIETAVTEKKENEEEVVVESTLEKQESFFAKFLNKNSTQFNDELNTLESAEIAHPSTPICDIVNCGENSNDTDYSTSTINNEINKSIALFEDDGCEVDRISNMRQLLTSSIVTDEIEVNQIKSPILIDNDNIIDEITEINDNDVSEIKTNSKIDTNLIDTIICNECGKPVDIDKLDTHADYHLALRLRNEERENIRSERKEKCVNKTISPSEDVKRRRPPDHSNKLEVSSITNFLVKIDETAPTETCPQCGKRIQKEKFPEHLDFHEAQKLSREINKKTEINEILGNSIKRKRKSSSPVKKPKAFCKSIASFFGK